MVTKWLQFGNKKLQNGNIVKHAQFAEGTIANWAAMYYYVFFCIFMHLYILSIYSLFMNKKRVVKLYRLTT